MKHAIKRMLKSSGIYAKWYKNIPFGIDWMLDIDRMSVPNWRPNVVFDVGANIGQTALAVADHWQQAKIYSFEPVRSTFESLSRNVAHLSRVSCHHCGLGEAEGRLSMHVLPNNVTNSLKSDHMANVAEAKIEEVTVTTIDSFAEKHGINSIDVLKTDTEGFDVEVFRGAARMLKTSAVSYVLVEVGFRSGDLLHTSMTQVNTLLNDYGFQVGGFYDTGNLASTHADGYCNALYYHREKAR